MGSAGAFPDNIVLKKVEDSVKEIGLKCYSLKIQAGATAGDNYLGEIVNVVAEGKDEDANYKQISLMIKIAPRSDFHRMKIHIGDMYIREIHIYKNVFPEFLKLQTCLDTPFNPFAICYNAVTEEGSEALIMRDMRQLGYRMQDRKKPLNYDHTLLVMKSYGRLHALSFALKDKNPQKFNEFADYTREFLLEKEASDDEFMLRVKNAYDALVSTNNINLIEKFDRFRRRLRVILLHELSEKAAGKYSVIGHGDCWINNFLFRYQDSSNPDKPTDLIFLDWQLSRVYSPVVDLSYFIFACTDKELRDKYYVHLLDEYYKSLSTTLKQLGCNPNDLFPREVFEEHTKKFLGYGLYMACMVLFLMLSEKEEVPDLSKFDDKTNETMMDFQIKARNVYDKRVTEIIQDASEYGYLL